MSARRACIAEAKEKKVRCVLCILKSQHGVQVFNAKIILSLLMVIYLFVLQSFSHRCERSAKAHRRESKTGFSHAYRGVSSSAKEMEAT